MSNIFINSLISPINLNYLKILNAPYNISKFKINNNIFRTLIITDIDNKTNTCNVCLKKPEKYYFKDLNINEINCKYIINNDYTINKLINNYTYTIINTNIKLHLPYYVRKGDLIIFK